MSPSVALVIAPNYVISRSYYTFFHFFSSKILKPTIPKIKCIPKYWVKTIICGLVFKVDCFCGLKVTRLIEKKQCLGKMFWILKQNIPMRSCCAARINELFATNCRYNRLAASPSLQKRASYGESVVTFLYWNSTIKLNQTWFCFL